MCINRNSRNESILKSLTDRAKSQIFAPFDYMDQTHTLDDFNREILTSMDWGVNKGDITKSVKVLPKPRQPHPNVKYSPLSPRQIKERSFINKIKTKEYINRLTDPSLIKREWNKSVLKQE